MTSYENVTQSDQNLMKSEDCNDSASKYSRDLRKQQRNFFTQDEDENFNSRENHNESLEELVTNSEEE